MRIILEGKESRKPGKTITRVYVQRTGTLMGHIQHGKGYCSSWFHPILMTRANSNASQRFSGDNGPAKIVLLTRISDSIIYIWKKNDRKCDRSYYCIQKEFLSYCDFHCSCIIVIELMGQKPISWTLKLMLQNFKKSKQYILSDSQSKQKDALDLEVTRCISFMTSLLQMHPRLLLHCQT